MFKEEPEFIFGILFTTALLIPILLYIWKEEKEK
jgi:hypothetical protein